MSLSENLPSYYRAGEVKALLDKQRRRHRRAVIWLVLYQIVLIVPVRMTLDGLAMQPKFAFIQPLILPSVALMGISLWVFGILMIFRRQM